MGQKVNPHGLRVGIIKDWDSRWFADKKEFGNLLVEDHNIRKLVKKEVAPVSYTHLDVYKRQDSSSLICSSVIFNPKLFSPFARVIHNFLQVLNLNSSEKI